MGGSLRKRRVTVDGLDDLDAERLEEIRVLRRTSGSSSTNSIVPFALSPRGAAWVGCGRAVRGASEAGKSTVKVVPRPGSRTMPRSADNPSPRPERLVLKNGSMMTCWRWLPRAGAVAIISSAFSYDER